MQDFEVDSSLSRFIYNLSCKAEVNMHYYAFLHLYKSSFSSLYLTIKNTPRSAFITPQQRAKGVPRHQRAK
jgi:hypothetical protein